MWFIELLVLKVFMNSFWWFSMKFNFLSLLTVSPIMQRQCFLRRTRKVIIRSSPFRWQLISINCISETKKSALFRVGSILIAHKNRNLVSILQYNAIITYCLLEYFRISMWSVKTSAWSVSGLREIHRFERALRHAAKQNILFSSFSKKLSDYSLSLRQKEG